MAFIFTLISSLLLTMPNNEINKDELNCRLR